MPHSRGLRRPICRLRCEVWGSCVNGARSGGDRSPYLVLFDGMLWFGYCQFVSLVLSLYAICVGQAAMQKTVAQAEAAAKSALSTRESGRSTELAAALANVKQLGSLLAAANGALSREKQDSDARIKQVVG